MTSSYEKALEEYHKERKTEKFYKTKGYKKILRYVLAIIQGDTFQKMIDNMRIEFKIPEKGYITPKMGTWSHPPKEWEFEEDYKKLEEIRKLLRTFCKDKGILPRDWHKILEDFLFYNRVLLTLEPNAKNLCFVSDGVTGLDSLGHKVDEDDLEIYPVTLHISPYASERDILDYIHAVYKPEIERVQNTYKRKDVGIGKYKKSNYAVSKRNAVIFNNRYSPSKKISRTIKEEFPEAPLKLSSINKTISREQKRRQQL